MADDEQQAEKRKVALTAELMRRGATLLNDACPRCGGIQIRFKERVYCVNEDDISSVLSGSAQNSNGVSSSSSQASPYPRQVIQPVAESREEYFPRSGYSEHDATKATLENEDLEALLEEKLDGMSKQLQSSNDLEQQERLLDLISKYLDVLQKLKARRRD